MNRFAVVLLLLALAGCGPGDAANGAPARPIILVLGQRGAEFFQALACGARDAARQLGVELGVHGPDIFDVTLQNPIIDSAVSRHPHALIAAPADSTSSAAPLLRAVKAGVRVILVDTVVAATRGSSSTDLRELGFSQELRHHPALRYLEDVTMPVTLATRENIAERRVAEHLYKSTC